MKITKLKIHNIGIIEDCDIAFDQPLLLFFGEIGHGKSTILKALLWCCGGEFPADIIRHGQEEAHIEIGLDDGIIRREFYVSKKDNATKARDVMFLRKGVPVPRPVNEIKRLFNPFLSNQDYLINMGETERKQYFATQFAVDTSALDTEAFQISREATQLRTTIDSYGDIDLTPVPKVDASALREKRSEMLRSHAEKLDEIIQANQAATSRNAVIASKRSGIKATDEQIAQVERRLSELKAFKAEAEQWIQSNPELVLRPAPPRPDTSDLDTKIEEAARNEERAKQLAENQARAKKKETEEARVKAIETRLRAIKSEKVSKLKEIGDKCGIKELSFDENGVFTYQGTQAGMLSTSQLMKLSSELSALYPPGLGVELIDRAESLGKSIFNFIDRAKAEAKTILATIVGEAPAESPDDVGVFVVESGKVTKKSPKAKAETKELL